jgi:spore maturation protein CgeB
MRILIVGNFGVTNIETFYERHLLSNGIEVLRFPLNKYSNRNILRRGLRYLIGGLYYFNLNTKLFVYILFREIKFVWIFKGYQVYWFTLALLKLKGVYLINYNPDHPYVRSFKSSGGPNVERSLKYYNLHLTYIKKLNIFFNQEKNFKSYLLPFGYEIGTGIYDQIGNLAEICEVAFVGNPDANRVEVIKRISAEGIKINLFGEDWISWLEASPYVQIHNSISGYEFWYVLRKYRVQLNIFREHNYDNHNMRFFEIPAVGGIQLVPSSLEISDYFEEEREVFTYSGLNELIDKIYLLLNMDEKTIQEHRIAARNKSVSQGYSYYDRTLHLLNIFKSENLC